MVLLQGVVLHERAREVLWEPGWSDNHYLYHVDSQKILSEESHFYLVQNEGPGK